MKVVFKKDCTIGNEYYFEGDELEVTRENIDKIWNLNEKGFISPITIKDFKIAERELKNPKSKFIKED